MVINARQRDLMRRIKQLRAHHDANGNPWPETRENVIRVLSISIALEIGGTAQHNTCAAEKAYQALIDWYGESGPMRWLRGELPINWRVKRHDWKSREKNRDASVAVKVRTVPPRGEWEGMGRYRPCLYAVPVKATKGSG